MKIRIKFAKRGNMKFIGHLDIMRYFQRAMRRADVDIAYSGGFSPHQKMSFAAPLGVGLMSEGEYMDIEVQSTRSSREMVEALNSVMAEGMEVLSYRALPDHAKNAMSLVAAAAYALQFREGYEPEDREAWEKAFLDFASQPEIIVTKKTKKGEKTMDLKPLLYAASAEGGRIFLTLSAGSMDNIKPEFVMEAFYESQGQTMPPFAFQITRLEVYADGGDEGERKLVPLDSFGQEVE